MGPKPCAAIKQISTVCEQSRNRLELALVNSYANDRADKNKIKELEKDKKNNINQINILTDQINNASNNNKGIQSKLDSANLLYDNTVISYNSQIDNLNTKYNDLNNLWLNDENITIPSLKKEYSDLCYNDTQTINGLNNDLKICAATILSNLANCEKAKVKLQQEAIQKNLSNNINVIKNGENSFGSVAKVALYAGNNIIKNDQTGTNANITKTEGFSDKENFTDLPLYNINSVTAKIEYRDIEHQKLTKLNKLLDTLFYGLFISFLLIIILIGNFNFKERFLFYLIIGLIPYIFPYIYKMCKYFYYKMNNNSYGPKNAFIDIKNDPYIGAYNV